MQQRMFSRPTFNIQQNMGLKRRSTMGRYPRCCVEKRVSCPDMTDIYSAHLNCNRNCVLVECRTCLLDKATHQNGANAVTDRYFRITPWAGLNLASVSFGPAPGRAKFIRRAAQVDCEGLAYLIPTTSDGDIGMTISLSGGSYDIIDQDQIWIFFLRKA
jgi:hypothetical protein